MAATVPTTVETSVATPATISVVQMLLSIDCSFPNSCSYQRMEKPVKLVRLFPSLKENSIR